MYRQGDVLLVPVEHIPATVALRPRGKERVVLAKGEATGHTHVIKGAGVTEYELNSLARYLEVPEGGAVLTHEEHAAIRVPQGAYRIVIQQEWRPEGSQDVID